MKFFKRNKILFTLLSLFLACTSIQVNAQLSSKKKEVFVLKGNDLKKLLDTAFLTFGINLDVSQKEVVVKPDMSRSFYPEMGLTTNPELVGDVIDMCYNGGAKVVYVFDNCKETWTKCYKNSGIEQVSKDRSAKVYPANSHDFFSEREITNGKTTTKLKVHNTLKKTTALIDVPVFRPDSTLVVAGALSNLLGCIFDWRTYKGQEMDQKIVDFLYYKNPVLTILDASKMALQQDHKKFRFVIVISSSVLAADAVACRLSGIDPEQILYLKICASLGLGTLRQEDLIVKELEQ